MRKKGSYVSLAAGMAVGGTLVGAAEGLYREAGVIYATFLYGALWSAAGLGLAACLTVLWSRKRDTPLFGAGLMLSLCASALILVRFIVIRDVFHEQPGANLKATLMGLAVALVIGLTVFAVSRAVRRTFYYEGVPRAVTWLVPILPLVIFAVLAQAGDDTLPNEAPAAKKLSGRGTILLVVDTLRADEVGPYGASPEATPNLDAFAKRGVVFEDVTAQASWTRPAVASLLTSRHVAGHKTMSKTSILPSSLDTLAEVMQAGGRKTAAVVTNYNLEPGYGFSQGFEQYRYLAPARYLGAPERANRLAAYNVYRVVREKLVTAGREARFFYRDGRTVNALGLEMLDRIGDEDFFLYLHYMEPHDPYFGSEGSFARVTQAHPPASVKDAMLAAYREEITRWDVMFGELLAALEARGLTDRVDIVVTADHGEEFHDHGGWWHGETLYQEQIHIPLIAAGPSFAPSVVSAMTRQIDIAPTLLASAGLTAPAAWEGRSLLDPNFDLEVVISEEDHNGNNLKAIRRGDEKMIIANPDNPRGLAEEEGFDLESDPKEQKPLTTLDGAKLQQLLVTALEAAAAGGAVAEQRDLTPEQEAELRSLGYVQ